MKENNNLLCCELHLHDLNIKVEIYKIWGKAHYKIFHRTSEILSRFDTDHIKFDLNSTIHLLSYLCEIELAAYETLTKYVQEYEKEKGAGPRTKYFQEAFKTNLPAKALPKNPTNPGGEPEIKKQTPKQKNSTPCCQLHLQDLDVKVELYNVEDRPYFKVFHKEKTIAGFNPLCISFDLKGILHLLSHLGTAELAEHETLAAYIKEYMEEEGRGPRTEYFWEAFQTNTPLKTLPKGRTRLNPERQARKYIKTGKLYIPTANSYFSGCGGLDIGLMQAGVDIIQSLDIDKKAIEIMWKNPAYFGHTILQEDMTEKLLEGQPETDIMAFTFPCDHYSTSADIHGTRTGDDLFHHAARHVLVRRPQMFIVENVPGMKKFKMVMETLTKVAGYYVYMFCPLDAALWLPQERERLILIATLKPFNIQAPVAAIKRPRIKDIIEKDVEIGVTNTVLNRIKGHYRDMPIVVDPNDPDAIAPCAFAHYEKDQGTRLVKDERYPYGLRPFTVREYARLQGFPDDFIFPDQKTSYRYIGNAVAVDMGRWIGEMAIQYFNKNSLARSYGISNLQNAA